ncbi:MAG: TolC family outer membrane protein [Hyphomonadaceae bacterium]|nr:TolC family outer membrane protein [Hyphomonadaceae bacterium]
MMRTFLFSAAALAAIAAPARAMTLPEAMQQALETNPTIEARRSRLAATREALPQARAAILPSLSVSAGATAQRRDGGGVGESTDESWSASASASQLLFASGAVAASTRQARAQVAGAEADYSGAVQQLLLDVTSAYAGLREAIAIVEARTRTAENLEAQRKFAQARFDAGVATRTDLAQAEARLAQARTQLIQAQGALAAANETYRRIVGASASGLQPAPRVEGLPASLEAALSLALEQSPSLVSARAAEEAAQAAVSSSYADRGPRVSLEAGSSLSGSFEDNESIVGGADDTSQSDSVGLRFSLPIFTGGAASSRTRQQRALRVAAGLDRTAAERTLRETVTTAWTSVDTARAAFVSAQEQVSAAETAYRGVTLEQDVGLRATVEVLDQENELLTARLALAAAERELAVAERRLLLAVGGLTAPR